MKMLTLDKFEEASEKVKEVTLETKLVYSDYLSDQTGNKVYLKPENMQFTGAYKVRGAYYKISTLSEEERQRGLITASAGNHAQGVAYAAKCYGCKVIVMPTTTPLIKVNRTKSYGAEVVLYGDVYDEACAHALELAEKNGYTFIHPFDDLAVATGQGTIAMEIFKELPLVEYILVPIGGGGLATGVSTLAKLLNPKIKVIGVEPEFFIKDEFQHEGLTKLIVTKDMFERKSKMIELGDVFIAFPGGTGTLEEVSEVVSKICLNQLSQPCIFYNLNGFYDDMKAFLQRMINVGFSTSERQHGIYFASNLTEIEHIIATHQA